MLWIIRWEPSSLPTDCCLLSVALVFPILPTHKKTKTIKTANLHSSLCPNALNVITVVVIGVGMVIDLGWSSSQFGPTFEFFKNHIKIRCKIWHHIKSGCLSSSRRRRGNRGRRRRSGSWWQRCCRCSRLFFRAHPFRYFQLTVSTILL